MRGLAGLSIGLLLVMALAGCAKPTPRYSAGGAPEIENEVIVPKGFDDVWGTLVAGLSSDFFVINNLEKESGLINVSFSASNPTEYVDCGRTTINNIRFGQGSHSYDSAQSTSYEAQQMGVGFISVRRTTNLDGRVNILVQEDVQGQTLVRANARYALSITVRAEVDGWPSSETSVVNFGTSDPTVTDGDLPGCSSRGIIEAQVLDYVRGLG